MALHHVSPVAAALPSTAFGVWSMGVLYGRAPRAYVGKRNEDDSCGAFVCVARRCWNIASMHLWTPHMEMPRSWYRRALVTGHCLCCCKKRWGWVDSTNLFHMGLLRHRNLRIMPGSYFQFFTCLAARFLWQAFNTVTLTLGLWLIETTIWPEWQYFFIPSLEWVHQVFVMWPRFDCQIQGIVVVVVPR